MAYDKINVLTEFLDRATIWILAFVYDKDETLTDPTAVKLSLSDPDGETKIDAQSMSKLETGIYEYYYHKDATADPMDTGEWQGEVDVIDGAGADAIISPVNFSFEVV